jgi:CheY-like chemotaxis protein
MPTILCVDDEPTQLTLLDFAFTRAGFTVLRAQDGQEAVEMAQAHKPDIILMDLMMSYKNGAVATAEIKALPETAHIPIVLFTAYETEDLAQAAIDAGVLEIIRKTTTPSQLVAKINHILGSYSKT